MDLLLNTVQPYDWGSTTALPRLMGTEPTGEPQAELWMGAHPSAPSRIDRGSADKGGDGGGDGGGPVPLDQVIAGDPPAELGAATLRRFGPRLPFLLKLLAADAPLSVQVHPDLAQARAGFAREEALGVPLDAPHRTYRDDQHKPEMIVALTAFQGLCGFRVPLACADLLDALGVPALRSYADTLRGLPEAQALAEVFTAFLSPPAGLVDDVTSAVVAAADRAGPYRADFAAYAGVARAHPGDSGLLAALMLRHVELAPGEALFLGAGIPHAYLSGLGVEIMASSDNVLRCGLTSKHVDTAELVKVVRFTAMPTRVLHPRAEGAEETYPAPVDDFRLSRFRPRAGDPSFRLAAGAPQILLCTEGEARLSSAGTTVGIGPGESVYVPAVAEVSVAGSGTLFRATVGLDAVAR